MGYYEVCLLHGPKKALRETSVLLMALGFIDAYKKAVQALIARKLITSEKEVRQNIVSQITDPDYFDTEKHEYLPTLLRV